MSKYNMKLFLYLFLSQVLLIGSLHNTYAQKRKPKPVKIVAANEFSRDSSFYTIERIQLKEFRNILEKNPTLVIQFFQPWCGGAKYWINDVVPFYSYWSAQHVPFFFISDNITEEDDFFISDTLVGRMVYYFNKYQIPFKTYIISTGESLEDYQNLMAKYFNNQRLKKHFAYLFQNGKRVYSGFTVRFFKKAIKKWKRQIK